MDWYQLWEIASAPDNVPIVIMLLLVPFYTWYGLRQAVANDRLIEKLEADPEMAKTHHRKTQPYKKGWAKEVHVWPFLLRIEFLAAIIVTVLLLIWSVALDAPLEEPANPNLTMNPAKAPWYFLGLQEMLVYFDPWIAGVVLPGLIVMGLMAVPYCDPNPLGSGYYTIRQRKFSVLTFLFGFIVLWVGLIMIGVFIRGPGWMWFWPGETWDHHRVVHETVRHLPDLVGVEHILENRDASPWPAALLGIGALGLFVAVVGGAFHYLFTKYKPQAYAKMNVLQYGTIQFLMISMVALPVKMVLWHAFNFKYALITPWFNI